MHRETETETETDWQILANTGKRTRVVITRKLTMVRTSNCNIPYASKVHTETDYRDRVLASPASPLGPSGAQSYHVKERVM